MIAFMIAKSVDDVLELFEAVKAGKRIEGDIPLTRLNNWLKLYHNHEKVVMGVVNARGKVDSDAKAIGDSYKITTIFCKKIVLTYKKPSPYTFLSTKQVLIKDRWDCRRSSSTAASGRNYRETVLYAIPVEQFNLSKPQQKGVTTCKPNSNSR